MIKPIFESAWRTRSRAKRRFYAKYMGWLERAGYVTVALVIAGFVFAFNYHVDDWIAAEDVAIQAMQTEVKPETEGFVAEILVEDWQEVPAGAVVARLAPTAQIAWRHQLWRSAGPSDRPADLADVSGSLVDLRAPVEGSIHLTDVGIGDKVDAAQPLATIHDYRRLMAEPELKGKTVPAAAAEQRARLTNIKIPGEADVLVRADLSGSAQVPSAISRRIVGPEFVDQANQMLKGLKLSVREDLPFEVDEVSSVEVDADVRTEPGTGQPAAPIDPAATVELAGRVASGEHYIKAQINQLPPSLQEQFLKAIEGQLEGRRLASSGIGPTFPEVRVASATDLRYVIKVKASALPAGTRADVQAAALERTFRAKIDLTSPPAGLIEAVRQADRAGRKVTAKIEVRTGSRPVAYFLLRKS